MKKRFKVFLGMSAAIVTLFACQSNAPSSSTEPSIPSNPIDEADMAVYREKLGLSADPIKGNIYLPLEVEGATVSWTSSNPAVISDKEEGRKAAGVVNRLAEDTQISLTANISKDGKTGSFTQTVTVKGLAKTLTEDDYEAYLFGHFIGEGAADQEQIYFALAEEGLNFKDLNDRKPVLQSNVGEQGVRDPYIYRSPEGDRFFLIATDLSIYHRGGWKINEQGYYDPSTTGSENLVLWQSDDLVNWGEPKLLPLAPEHAGMAWAPEMIFDEVTGQYIVFFASSIMNEETKMKDKPNAIYYAATRDFEHFSPTSLFIDNQVDGTEDKPREIIDTTILRIGDVYYSCSKDGDNNEANGGIRIMSNRDLLNPQGWEKVLDLDELGLSLPSGGWWAKSTLDNSTLEGPEFFVYNKKDRANPDVPEYGLMADQYSSGSGYIPLSTTNILDVDNSEGSWKLLDRSEYSFDQAKKRHGTILRLTKEEAERIKTHQF